MKKRKLLFVHDGPLYYDKKGLYYEYSYSGLFERYSYLASDITFLMRTEMVSGETKGNILNESINVLSVPNYKCPNKYFSLKSEADAIIKEAVSQADLVVIRLSSNASIAYKYLKQTGKPFIYESVGCVWDSLWNHSIIGKLIAPFVFSRTRREIRNSEYVYYVTDEFLQRRYPTKGKFIGCSNVVINDINIHELEKRKEKLKSLDMRKKCIIGTAAAIDVKYKGQEYVIKAIPELVQKGYDVEYWLAGGNRTGNKYLANLALKLGISDRVKYLGSLNREELEDYYRSIDVYIQPSKQEGLPRAVIEAMSFGCICFGSNIAGIPELLDEQFLFRKGNVKEIVNKIIKLESLDKIAIAERNFNVAKKYCIDKLTIKREAFYDDFLKDYGFI